MAAKKGWQNAQFLHLTQSFMFYENFMLILNIDVPVLLNSCGNSEQRSKLVSQQLITHTKTRAVLSGCVGPSTSLNTYMPHIAEGTPFHREHNSLEMRTMTKNSPEKQILSEKDPICF